MLHISDKVSLKEKIGFSAGDTASNLFFQTFVNYLLIFYTDVFGLPSKVAGTMFLITRVWDAVNDPIMGMVADRTKTKWGKFRPFIIWMALPFGVMGFFMFMTPEFGSTGKVIYAYITYTLMMMIYTAINVPYSALMGVITSNSQERTTISSFRFVAAYIGLLIITTSAEALVKIFGGVDAHGTVVDPQKGWQMAMGCFSILAVILWLFTFFTTKERVDPPANQKTDFKRDGGDLFRNVPWLLIAGATVLQLTYIVMRGSIVPYYVKYLLGDHSIVILGMRVHLSLSHFLTSGAVATLIGAILTGWIVRIIDKKVLYGGSLAISAGSCLFFFILSPDNIGLIYAVNIFGSVFLGPVAVLQWAMYTDVADYGEWKFNRRATGLIMAASLFALKLGVALGGAIVAWKLASYGFKPNELQTASTLSGIRMLMGIFTAVVGVAGSLLIIMYPLDNKRMEEIEKILVERRSGTANLGNNPGV